MKAPLENKELFRKDHDPMMLEIIEEIEKLSKNYCKHDMPTPLVKLLNIASDYRLKNPKIFSSLTQFISDFYDIENNEYFESQNELKKIHKEFFESVFLNDSSKNVDYEVANCKEQIGLFFLVDNKHIYLLSNKESGTIIKELTDLENIEYLVYIDTNEKEGCFLGESEIVEGTLTTFDNFENAIKHINSLINN